MNAHAHQANNENNEHDQRKRVGARDVLDRVREPFAARTQGRFAMRVGGAGHLVARFKPMARRRITTVLAVMSRMLEHAAANEIGLVARELAMDAMGFRCLRSQARLTICLIGLEVAFEEVQFPGFSSVPSHARMCVAMRSRNQRSWLTTTEQPGEVQKRLF